MSGSPAEQATADVRRESFPTYEGGLHYIEGYDPVSYEAPHSSLITYTAWIGAALILLSLFLLGVVVWGASLGYFGLGSPAEHWQLYTIVGAVATVVFFAAGLGSVWYARRNYRRYRAETGRMN